MYIYMCTYSTTSSPALMRSSASTPHPLSPRCARRSFLHSPLLSRRFLHPPWLAHLCACMHPFMHVCMGALRALPSAFTPAAVVALVNAAVGMYIHMCIHACTCTYIYMHIRVHTCSRSGTRERRRWHARSGRQRHMRCAGRSCNRCALVPWLESATPTAA